MLPAHPHPSLMNVALLHLRSPSQMQVPPAAEHASLLHACASPSTLLNATEYGCPGLPSCL